MGPGAAVGEGDGRLEQGFDPPDSTSPGTIGPVTSLWLLLIPVVLIGGFFLVRGFIRVTAALKGLRANLDEMSEAGLRLRDLQGDLDRLTETMERARRR